MDVIQTLKDAAKKYGVDEKLVLAVAKQESGYNPYIVSGAGAVGVMQLMPGTARGLGVDPYDPAQNIDGGVRYIKAKLTEFGGNVESALAAYNAGSAAVRKYDGVPPYKETQNYVKSIKAMMGGEFPASGGGDPVVSGGTISTWNPTPWENVTSWFKGVLGIGNKPGDVPIQEEIDARKWAELPTEELQKALDNSPAGDGGGSAGTGVWDWVQGGIQNFFIILAGITLSIIGVVLLVKNSPASKEISKGGVTA